MNTEDVDFGSPEKESSDESVTEDPKGNIGTLVVADIFGDLTLSKAEPCIVLEAPVTTLYIGISTSSCAHVMHVGAMQMPSAFRCVRLYHVESDKDVRVLQAMGLNEETLIQCPYKTLCGPSKRRIAWHTVAAVWKVGLRWPQMSASMLELADVSDGNVGMFTILTTTVACLFRRLVTVAVASKRIQDKERLERAAKRAEYLVPSMRSGEENDRPTALLALEHVGCTSRRSGEGGARVSTLLPLLPLKIAATFLGESAVRGSSAGGGFKSQWPDPWKWILTDFDKGTVGKLCGGFPSDMRIGFQLALIYIANDVRYKAKMASLLSEQTHVRSATLAKPSRTTHTRLTDSKLLLSPVHNGCSFQKGSAKMSIIWIGYYDVVQKAIRNGTTSHIAELFTRHYIVSDNKGQLLTVAPPVHELPYSEVESRPVSGAGGERLITLTSSSLFQHIHVYESLRKIAGLLEVQEGDLSALRLTNVLTMQDVSGKAAGFQLARRWLGMQKVGHASTSAGQLVDENQSVWDTFFGPLGERRDFLAFVEREVGYKLTLRQKDFLNTLRGPLTVCSFVAGAGKTHLSTSIMSWIVQKIPTPPLIVAMTTTNLQAGELQTLLETKLDPDRILRIAVLEGSDGTPDTFEAYLRDAALDRGKSKEGVVLTVMDKVLSALIELWRLSICATCPEASRNALQRVALHVLAMRHTYLENSRNCLKMRQQDAVDKVQVLVGTTSQMIKLFGSQSPWSAYIEKIGRRVFGFMDEFQTQGFQPVLSILGALDNCMLFGDPRQLPQHAHQNDAPKTLGECLGKPSGGRMLRESTLQWQLAPSWAESVAIKCGTIQYLKHDETLRFGSSITSLIERVFRREFHVTSHPHAPCTTILPTLFRHLPYESYDLEHGPPPYYVSSMPLFASAAIVVAVETIMAVASRSVQDARKHTILVIAFRRKVLWAFQDYLLHVLPTLCTKLCDIYDYSGHREKHTYDMYTLMQQDILQFKAAQNANGSSATACIGLLFKRRPQDRTWAGDETEEHLLFQYLTRVSKRLYPFVEDLRPGMLIPPKYHARASRMGFPPWQLVNTGHEAPAQRQLLLARFYKELEAIYCEQMGVPDEYAAQKISWLNSTTSVSVLERLSFAASVSSDHSQSPNECLQKVSRHQCTREEMTRLRGMAECMYLNCQTWGSSARAHSAVEYRDGPICDLLGSASQPLKRELWERIFGRSDAQATPAPPPSLPCIEKFSERMAPEDDTHPELYVENTGPTQEQIVHTWRPVAIDAVSVHLQSEVQALVIIPLADAFTDRGADKHWLLRLLWSHAATELDAWNRRHGTFHGLCTRVARHKKQSYEYGADRFVVTACRSDRVAFQIWSVKDSDASGADEQLLFHFYCAMGLFLQHEDEVTLLARCYHHAAAAALVKVVGHVLGVPYRTENLRVLETHESAPQWITSWTAVASGFDLDPFTDNLGFDSFIRSLADGTGTLATLQRQTEHKQILLALQTCLPTHLQSKLTEILSTNVLFEPGRTSHAQLLPLPAIDFSSTFGQHEPPIRWVHASPRGQTPPSLVPAVVTSGTRLWHGKLYLAPLDAVLSGATLKYYSVGLVINCLGMYTREGLSHTWQISHRKQDPGVQYVDFPTGYELNRLPWAEVFKLASQYLSSGKTVFVHCRDGKDRSAYAVYQFLRRFYHCSHASSLCAIQVRVTIDDLKRSRVWREISL